MPAELARVDELLDDPVFFEPFRPFFDPSRAEVRPDGDVPAAHVPEVPLPARL